MENKIKSKKIFWLVLALLVVFLATLASFNLMSKNISSKQPRERDVANSNFGYTILGVPYFGIYNHRDSLSSVGGYMVGNSCVSVLEILEYWYPGQNHFEFTCNNLGNKTVDDFVRLFLEKNFTVEMTDISLTDLKKYLNSEVRTPLILFLPISSDQPASISYFPATVLIGINEVSQKLIMHNYWLGNNYEMSFDEFNKLEEKLPSSLKNKYIIAQPENLGEKIKELSQRKQVDYSARTSIMRNGEQMFKDYSIGSGGAYSAGLWPQALEYFSKVENSPTFDEFFPPYFKTILYYQKARIFFLKDDLDSALVYAQKSVAINNNLDKPFKDWPGYETNNVRPDRLGIAPEPFIILGEILDKRGDLSGSLASYKKAFYLMINTNSINSSIRNLRLEMAKKGIVE